MQSHKNQYVVLYPSLKAHYSCCSNIEVAFIASKDSHTPRASEPPETDDLKFVHDVSPAVEGCLHCVGIYVFTQLTALSPADIAASVTGLSGLTAERIIKQDWIGQAHKLAKYP